MTESGVSAGTVNSRNRGAGGAAGFDILQHRRLVRADRFSTGDALVDGDAEGDAELLRDVLGFLHHGRSQFARLRELANVH